MIKRKKDYLMKEKRKYIIGTIIGLIAMFSVFGVGYFLNKTRNNIFTVIAAVLVLPAAQYITKLFAILKFKDPDMQTSNNLEKMKGNYNLFHSVLIPDQKAIFYFDHIVVTGTKIYCIIDNATDFEKNKEVFNNKMKAKGIPKATVVYIDQSRTKVLANVLKQIETNATIENEENINEYTQLIAQMMM